MTDSSGEHHSPHHASHSKDGFATYVLPVSILLAAVIVGWSMMSAATTLSEGLTTGGGTVVPPIPNPDNGTGTVAPGVTKTMAELAATDYAGKLGSDSAPVVMIEYSDFQCPFCRRYYTQTSKELIQKYVDDGKVQILFKDFPLSFHPLAPMMANAARCAGDQGKFWEMHDKLFDEQQILDPSGGTVSNITTADVKEWATELGLTANTFNSCLDSNKYDAEIQANMAEGSAVGVGGTPSFVIGKRDATGQLVVGAQPTATFTATIDQLLG